MLAHRTIKHFVQCVFYSMNLHTKANSQTHKFTGISEKNVDYFEQQKQQSKIRICALDLKRAELVEIERVAETRINEIKYKSRIHTQKHTRFTYSNSWTATNKITPTHTHTIYKIKINLPKECWQKSAANASNTYYFFFFFD